MKPVRAVLATLILAGVVLAAGARAEGGVSVLFTLDTRDPDLGTESMLFTLDTRGELLPISSVFTLDTRGPELFYAPQNLLLVPEQLTVARATWEYFGTPLGFHIQRRDPLGEWESTTVSGGSVRSWADTSVRSGNFYEYRVAAVLPDGVSEYSEIASIQMPELPQAPRGLGATVTEAGSVELAWQDMSDDEQGFEVWRKAGLEGVWGSLAQTEANAASYLDSAVSSSTLYAYKVRAFNSWGNSGFSEEARVATPDSGTGCGYLLRVDEAALFLDGAAMDPIELNQANGRALLRGGLLAFIRSPPGNPHPVRVVLGFRDGTGRAVGCPVELVDFYCIPKCPGLFVKTVVPEDFRAPEAGTNTLWLEMIMAQRDPVEAFMTERHTQESPMRKRLFNVAIQPDEFAETRVRVLEGSTTPWSLVDVPVQLISKGGESSVAFSLAFGDGIEWVGALPGTDAPQALLETTAGPSNAMGVLVRTPLENPLGEGSKHLLTLRFLAKGVGETTIRFQDRPVEREIVPDPAGMAWENGLVTVAANGLEGDVSPQPDGDGVVDDQDSRLARQFVLGILDLPTGPDEFQRLDCAPVETCGDGIVDMADVVTIMQYASGQLTPEPACGPTNQIEFPPIPTVATKGDSPRRLSIGAPEEVQRGASFWATIDLAAQGDEHGLSASLSFDPDVLAYQDMRIVGPATNGVFLPNLEALSQGAMAFGVILAEGENFAPGNETVAEILFVAQEGNGTEVTSLDYAQTPAECRVVGLDSEALESTYAGSDVIVAETISLSAPLPPESGEALALAMDQIKVSWTPAAWATGYRVRRKLAGETVWTKLVDCEATRSVFVDDGLPPGTVCHYLITALNPQGDESAALRLQAQTWTALEQWRDTWFGQIENTGIAADTADPDDDDLPNLLEHQLGTDPLVPNNLPYRLAQEEVFAGLESLTLTYAVSGGAPGHVAFEFTEDLLQPIRWRNEGVAPVSLRKSGGDDLIKVRLPEGVATNRLLFLRMKTE